jgi:hypothetical protein
MNGLASYLELSLAGVRYHLNRHSTVKSKSLGLLVRVFQEGIEAKGIPMEKYNSKKKLERI